MGNFDVTINITRYQIIVPGVDKRYIKTFFICTLLVSFKANYVFYNICKTLYIAINTFITRYKCFS